MPTSTLPTITRTEAKLVMRDGASVFFSIIFPAMLLVVLSFVIPGFREPVEELADFDGGRYAGLAAADFYTPVVLALAIITVAISIVPTYLATYREQGVLRRLATTPASPRDVLGAQLIVNLGLLVVGSALAVASALTIVGVEPPQNVPALLVSFALATIAALAIGLVIASVAPTARATTAITMIIYFPLLFFAGVWTPGPAMPEALRRVADFTPSGAAAEAMTDAWLGDWPEPLHVVVLIAWGVLAGLTAARVFRWQ